MHEPRTYQNLTQQCRNCVKLSVLVRNKPCFGTVLRISDVRQFKEENGKNSWQRYQIFGHKWSAQVSETGKIPNHVLTEEKHAYRTVFWMTHRQNNMYCHISKIGSNWNKCLSGYIREDGEWRLAVRHSKRMCAGAVAEVWLKGQGMDREHDHVINFDQRNISAGLALRYWIK